MNMLLDMGVDGIISDKPWLLKQVLEKRNIKLHTPTVNVDSPYHTGTAQAQPLQKLVTAMMPLTKP